MKRLESLLEMALVAFALVMIGVIVEKTEFFEEEQVPEKTEYHMIAELDAKDVLEINNLNQKLS